MEPIFSYTIEVTAEDGRRLEWLKELPEELKPETIKLLRRAAVAICRTKNPDLKDVALTVRILLDGKEILPNE